MKNILTVSELKQELDDAVERGFGKLPVVLSDDEKETGFHFCLGNIGGGHIRIGASLVSSLKLPIRRKPLDGEKVFVIS